jgi:hypothetical protein
MSPCVLEQSGLEFGTSFAQFGIKNLLNNIHFLGSANIHYVDVA